MNKSHYSYIHAFVAGWGLYFQTGNISGMAGDAECYDEANDFVREAIAGMADDAEYKRLST